MGLNKTKILGISITTSPKEEILEEVRKRLKSASNKDEKPFIVVTPNPEQLVLAQKDIELAEILNKADVAIPDGIGLVWAMHYLAGMSDIKRIPGVELMEDLVRLSARGGYTIGLIGGWHGVAVATGDRLLQKYPELTYWALEPEAKTLEEITKKIADTNTRLVFVGLGAPKQEYFIEKLQAPVVAMAVGGSFDIIAGRTHRAPFLLRTIGVEWLWRLMREPGRWRRQLALMRFLLLVVRTKLQV